MANDDDIQLMDLPAEVIESVFDRLCGADAVRLCCAVKGGWCVYKGWGKSRLAQAMNDAREGLLAGRREGDYVEVDVREAYMGGAQPEDGDFVSISQYVCGWKVTNAANAVGAWNTLGACLRDAAFLPMVFVHVRLSWESEYELDESVMYARYHLPADVKARVDALHDKVKRVMECAGSLITNNHFRDPTEGER